MKLWIKYLISLALASLAALLIPWNDTLIDVAETLSHYAVQTGRYLLFPLVFFTLAIAVTQLRRYKKLGSVLLRLVIKTVVAALGVLIIGIVVSLILSPERIPILMQEDIASPVITWRDYMDQLIPGNLFRIFFGDASMLLPLAGLSFLMGYHFFFDKEQAEPAYNLFDSLSRLFYRINHFFVKYGYVPLFFISLLSIAQIRSIEEFQLYGQLLLILAISSVLILLVIYPLTLYFFGGRDNPLAHVYAILAPLTAALSSGDIYFSYGILTRHIKENEGIPREITGLAHPLLTLFSRAGTALVTCCSMLLIISSYSSLEITFFQILWVFFFSFILSFALSAAPRMGVYVMLSLMCQFYGRGLEQGYMLLIPILPLLMRFAALLDTAVVTLILRLTAFNEDFIDEVHPSEYI